MKHALYHQIVSFISVETAVSSLLAAYTLFYTSLLAPTCPTLSPYLFSFAYFGCYYPFCSTFPSA